MTHEELEDAVPLYAIGALERVERQALEAHLLSGCVACHTALKQYQSVAAILPFGLNTAAPPRGLKRRILTQAAPVADANAAPPILAPSSLEPGEWINHLFPPAPSSRAARLGWAMGVAALAILALLGYIAWDAYTRVLADNSMQVARLQTQADVAGSHLTALQRQMAERDTTLAQLREELERRTAEAAELKEQLIEREAQLEEARVQVAQRGGRLRAPQDELADLLRIPTVKAVSLTGSDLARQAAGILLFDERGNKAWFYSINLPECPNGMTYQLWAIQEKPVSLGTFHMDSGETTHLLVKRVPFLKNAQQFAVSLELSGGRPHPTGSIYLTSAPDN